MDRPRLLLGARKMTFHGDLTIDAPFLATAAVTSVVEKTGRNGPLSIVTLDHVLTPAGATAAAVTDQQTYYLAGLPQPGAPARQGHPRPICLRGRLRS